MGDLKQALDMVKSILDMMKGGGGGGGGGGQPQTTPTTDPTLGGCSRYYNVTQPSSDPCAVYVPPVSDSLGSSTGSGATDLISSLLGGTNTTNTGTPAVTNPTAATTQTTQAPVTAQVTSASTGTPRVGVPAGTPATTLNPGVFGDIQYSTNEVTVLVNNVDTKSGTQVAGFYGTPAGGQPTGVIANMCQSRPWATNFLSSIIPSAFFDSLCQLRGYQTTAPKPVEAAAPTRTVVTNPVAAPKPAAPTSTTPTVPPQVDIWAVPASVPLGARTTVFWNAKGVASCTVTSPDGSFSQNTLSGGAATVPLSGATTYTISCLTADDKPATDYVTVELSSN